MKKKQTHHEQLNTLTHERNEYMEDNILKRLADPPLT